MANSRFSAGAIVHYVGADRHYPAMILHLGADRELGECDLITMDLSDPFVTDCFFDPDTKAPSTWHWAEDSLRAETTGNPYREL